MRQSKMCCAGLRNRFSVIVVAAMWLTSSAHAVDKFWTGASSSFASSSAWNPSGMPGTFDTAIFGLGNLTPPDNLVLFLTGGFQPIDAVVDKLRIDSNPVTFTPSQSTLTIDSTNITETARGLVIGRTPPGGVGTSTAVLNTLLGNLSTVYATLGADAGSSGTLNLNPGLLNVTGTAAGYDLIIGLNGAGAINMSGGSAVLIADDTMLAKNAGSAGSIGISGAGSNWINGGFIYVGSSGNGMLNINGGGTLVSDWAYIAGSPGSTSSAVIDGSGSAWTSTDFISIGNAGIGGMSIISGGRVQDEIGYIASAADSTGNVTVFGSGSRWINNDDLFVGYGGDGLLQIAGAGARVDNDNGEIGFSAGSTGTVTVAGSGALWHNSAHLYVGRSGEATLNISAGAQVENTHAFIGYASGSTGEVTVTGSNADWDCAGDISVGTSGDGALNILDGGSVFSATSSIGDLAGSTGDVVLQDAGSVWVTSSLFVGRGGPGTLAASANTIVSAPALQVGGGPLAPGTMLFDAGNLLTYSAVIGGVTGSVGTVTLENLGLWDHYSFAPADPFIVGDEGAATLNILSDSHVFLNLQTLPILGNGAAGHGTVNIDGQGSEMFVEIQSVTVGRMGTGVLNITAGGLLQAASSVVYLAELPDSDGTVHIAGSNSLFRGSLVLVGNAGTGTLDISAGGRLEANEVSFASFPDSSGTATINGNSRLSALTGNGLLIVGGADSASLTVSNGGVAEALEVFIGDGSTADGNVTVSGATSQLIGQEQINVGYFGTGLLTLTNGGKAIAPFIDINQYGSVKGNGTLQGDVTNFGEVAPGLSAGTLNVNGDYTQSSLPAPPGELVIELASASSFDRLLVTGTATLGGTLTVNLINGFIPSAGQTYTILTSDDVDNAFAQVNAPSGITVAYTPTAVILQVVSTPCPADVNNSGEVDVDDLIAVILGWGGCANCSPPNCAADINNDCMVDVDDLIAVILSWGACP
jgi:T5SS/PEP-CTERM-associated repeat protein